MTSPSFQPVLDVSQLHVDFLTDKGVVSAVRGVDLTVAPGEVLGLVGESGSGKTTTALAIPRLFPGRRVRVAADRMSIDGEDLRGATADMMKSVRGNRVGMVFQDPGSALNPIMRIGDQVAEPLRTQKRLKKSDALDRVVEMLSLVGIPRASERLRAYPHELSGGQRQRVVIAMALILDPPLVIADEPTTALDVTVQAEILDMLRDLRSRLNTSFLFISHNLAVVASFADRVAIMYAGRVVEHGPVQVVLSEPRHPYTIGLLNCVPRLSSRLSDLEPIAGAPPSLDQAFVGCTFAPRCSRRTDRCLVDDPPLEVVGGHPVACWNPAVVE